LEAEDPQVSNGTAFTPARLTAALILSLAGCIFIWIATPYNNFVLKNGYISDDYLMPSVLAVLLFVILILNPAIRMLRSGWGLNFRQIALITGILFMGAALTSNGLLRCMPYSLARQVSDASEWKETAEYYESADMPASLFPGKMGYREDVEDVHQFLVKLPKGEPIPWGTWLPPSISWLAFFFFFWLMCVSMAGIMLPQWQQTERIPFPLTRILQTLMETPGENRLLPKIFLDRRFWIAALVVIVVHSLIGLNTYFPDRVPAFQTTWSLAQIFTEEPLSYLPDYMKSGKFYFTFIGVAYFMSTRVSFSIWFFMVAYALYTLIGQAYFPPFYGEAPVAQRSGALLAIIPTILWLGRARLFHVFRCAVYPSSMSGSDADKRDRNYFYMFWIGILGMCGWMVWIGVQIPWAILLAAIICIYQLTLMRIVAETGLPVAGLYDEHFHHYFKLIPIRWVNGASAWFMGAMSSMLGGTGTRSSLAAFAMQSMSLDENARPRRQWKTARYYVVVLVLSFFICGVAHIFFSYQYSQTLDSNPEVPISAWGSYRLGTALEKLREQVKGDWDEPAYSLPAHMAFGAILAGGLQYASLTMPKWPLHPVGVILAYSWFGATVWMSVAVGWLLRVVLIMFGGARVYRRLRPAFIGLIIGEAIAGIIWFSLSGILALCGQPYKVVSIFPV